MSSDSQNIVLVGRKIQPDGSILSSPMELASIFQGESSGTISVYRVDYEDPLTARHVAFGRAFIEGHKLEECIVLAITQTDDGDIAISDMGADSDD